MKDNIILLGGSLFNTMLYNEGEFVPIYNNLVNYNSIKYNIHNYSINNKEISFYYNYLKAILNYNVNYKTCYLYLGEVEANNIYDKDKFIKYIDLIINLLNKYNINAYIYLLPYDSYINKIILDNYNDITIKYNNIKMDLVLNYN